MMIEALMNVGVGWVERSDTHREQTTKRFAVGFAALYPPYSLNTCIEKAKADGYVETILGRRRAIPGIHDRNGQVRALAERLAINSVVQGSAADLIKVAMVNLQTRIEQESLPCKLLLQIHDELVIEAPASQADAMAEVLVNEMRSAMELKVPLDVEAGIGKDWFGAK